MLTHPHDPAYTLLEVADLEADPPAVIVPHVDTLRSVVRWMESYLCRPHPELGRTGNVCPYAPAALERGTVYLTVAPAGAAEPEVRHRLEVYRDWFAELSAEAGPGRIFHAVLMVFADLPADRAPARIERLQRLLKPGYVSRGLMIGEFHDGPPDAPGIWNADFRPLRCPIPILAIRHMVPSDFPFLESDRDQVRMYLDHFAPSVPAHIRNRIATHVDRSIA